MNTLLFAKLKLLKFHVAIFNSYKWEMANELIKVNIEFHFKTVFLYHTPKL